MELYANLLELRYAGNIDGAAVRDSLVQIRGAIGRRAVDYGLVDVLKVTKINGDIHPPSQDVLRYFKTLGMRELVLVMGNPIIRMIVRATSLVTGLPTRSFEHVTQARAYLHQHGVPLPGTKR